MPERRIEVGTLKECGLTRAAAFQPESINVEKRTAEMVWTTGARVQRVDWYNGQRYIEELSLEKEHVRMGRLKSGSAPLLNSHWSTDLRDVIGVVESASIKDGEGRAVVRFSDREDVEPIWRDVQNGIIRNVSVGYAVYRVEARKGKDDIEIRRAVDWEPMELSLVPMGADPAAGIRAGGVVATVIEEAGFDPEPEPEPVAAVESFARINAARQRVIERKLRRLTNA